MAATELHADDGRDAVEKLRWLRVAIAEGGDASATEVIETHMSWVLLHGERVFKLKKPVRHPFLDFSTVHARGHDAREELRLNRRLAPDVYLGVCALRHDALGWRLGALDSAGDAPESAGDAAATVDWIVVMRRLPAERMLDRVIADGAIDAAALERLADLLARFYRGATPAAVDAATYLARCRVEDRINRKLLLEPAWQPGLQRRAGRPPVAALLDAVDRAFEHHAPLLAERVAQRRIVDGHGDLRPEHVCLVAPTPVVIDCLEFNAALREVDPIDEIALLGVECALLGAAAIGPRLADAVAQRLGDPWPVPVAALYAARRAMLRARLAAAHLRDARPRTPQRWLPLAGRYLDAAEAALHRLQAM